MASSHKKRTGLRAALIVLLCLVLVCAVAAAVLGESASLISAVAVLPEFHRRGLGTAVVRKMERMLPSGTVYILREESKNEAFYDALGYKPCGAWAQGKLCN